MSTTKSTTTASTSSTTTSTTTTTTKSPSTAPTSKAPVAISSESSSTHSDAVSDFATTEQPTFAASTTNTPQGIAHFISAPPYILLVLLQVPIQILFSFYRDVRQLGTVSWLA